MHTTRAYGLTLALLYISFISLVAQDRQTVTQGIEWFAAHSVIDVGKRVSILAEGHFRTVQAFEPMQMQLRGGIDIVLNKHWSIMPLGYVYTWNPLYGKQPNAFVNNEHRLFEQFVFKHAV